MKRDEKIRRLRQLAVELVEYRGYSDSFWRFQETVQRLIDKPPKDGKVELKRWGELVSRLYRLWKQHNFSPCSYGERQMAEALELTGSRLKYQPMIQIGYQQIHLPIAKKSTLKGDWLKRYTVTVSDDAGNVVFTGKPSYCEEIPILERD